MIKKYLSVSFYSLIIHLLYPCEPARKAKDRWFLLQLNFSFGWFIHSFCMCSSKWVLYLYFEVWDWFLFIHALFNYCFTLMIFYIIVFFPMWKSNIQKLQVGFRLYIIYFKLLCTLPMTKFPLSSPQTPQFLASSRTGIFV